MGSTSSRLAPGTGFRSVPPVITINKTGGSEEAGFDWPDGEAELGEPAKGSCPPEETPHERSPDAVPSPSPRNGLRHTRN